MDQAHTPTWRANCRQNIVGSPPRGIRDSRFVSGGARNQEPDGDTRRRDNDLDRFGPSDRRNTLRHVSLVYCIDLYVDPI